MNVKAIIPLVAGLAIAGLAAKLGFDYVSKAKGAQEQRTTVWAAADDIPRGASIGEEMLRAVHFPTSALPAGTFADKAKLVGRVPRVVAPAGLPVLETMLAPAGTRPGVFVPPGMRAVAVKIDESSGVDNHLQPGVRVDVVGSFTRKAAGGNEVIARTIVENIEVGAVGERISVGGTGAAEQSKDGKKPAAEKPARAVTLLVNPEQARLLHLAEQRGKIKVTMRGEDDTATTGGKEKLVSESEMMGEGPPKSAAPNLIASIFSNLTAKRDARTRAPSKALPIEKIVAAEKPRPAWTMKLHNGDKEKLLAWATLTSMEPFEYQSPQTPNMFENPTMTPPGPPPAVAPPAAPQPAPAPEPEPEPQTEPEENN